MPTPVCKIDFSAARMFPDDARRLRQTHNNVLPFTPDCSARAAQREPQQIPWCRRNEAISAILLALILHLAGFIVISDAPQEHAVMPPTSIQVSWIAAPRQAPETSTAAPPKRQRPAQKPAPKTVKRIKPRHNSVLKTHAPATKMAAAPAKDTAKAPMPTAAKPAAPPLPSFPAKAAQPYPTPAAASQSLLTLPSLHADYLNNPAPPYPEEARERYEQGKVLLRALITADGAVAELRVKRSSGYASLDRSALETVKKWRFVPTRRGADAVSAWVVVPITFSLEG